MASSRISVNNEELEPALKTLADWVGGSKLPSSSAMRHIEGANVGAAKEFYAALEATSESIASLVDGIRHTLRQHMDALRLAATDLNAQDESNAAETAALLARLDTFAPTARPALTSGATIATGASRADASVVDDMGLE